MKSRRRSTTTPPDPVFFTDRNLGAELFPGLLRQAGFALVIHDEHFGRRQDVLDPEVIRACGENRWFLMTADSDLPRRWVKEVSAAQIGVFCQTNNHQGPRLWAPRICSLKSEIIALTRKEARPFTAYITAEIKPQLLLKKA